MLSLYIGAINFKEAPLDAPFKGLCQKTKL
jgi:hypothetical protein